MGKHIALPPSEMAEISHFQGPASISSFSIKNMGGISKAYEPPVPKHLIPTNNPFYNKQLTIGSDPYRGELGKSESGRIDRPTPRSLLNWINSSNTKKVQQRITNRMQYLKQMS
jgi:hypothetical protein